MLKEHSAGFVVFKQIGKKREYLILHYPGGHYDFAKGHLEKNESPKEAAIRELKEETGLESFKLIPAFEQNIYYSFRRGKVPVSKTVTYYLCEALKYEIKLSDEHIGYYWLEYDLAKEKVTFDNAKLLLEKSEKFLKKINYEN